MTDRTRTLAEERAQVALTIELDRQRQDFEEMKLRWDMIPGDWHSIEREVPVHPKKTKVTIGLDADLVRWFRSMGQGHQARMNRILRTFMLATIAKEVRLRSDLDRYGDPIEDRNKKRRKWNDLDPD